MNTNLPTNQSRRLVHGVVSASHVSNGPGHLKSSLLGVIATLERHHRLTDPSDGQDQDTEVHLDEGATEQPTIPNPGYRTLPGRLLLVGAKQSRIAELYGLPSAGDPTSVETLQVLAELYGFFTLLRACVDDVAVCISEFSRRRGQLPMRMPQLLKFCREQPNRLEPRIVDALSSDMSWFNHMKSVRDALIHEYAETILYRNETLMFDLLKGTEHGGPERDVHRMFDGDDERLGIDLLDLTAHYLQSTFSYLEHVGDCLFEHAKATWGRRIKFYYEACLQGVVADHLSDALNRDLSGTVRPWKSSQDTPASGTKNAR